MALDLTKTFCTATTEIERYAAFDFTTTSVPTEAQVEEYAYDVASKIVFRAQDAGTACLPPVSTISNTHLARLLTQANAVGAAFEARAHIFTLNGDDRSKRVMERLLSEWESFMGKGSASGGVLGSAGTGGSIAQAITTASGSRLLVSPVSDGEVELADLSTRTQDIPYTTSDRD